MCYSVMRVEFGEWRVEFEIVLNCIGFLPIHKYPKLHSPLSTFNSYLSSVVGISSMSSKAWFSPPMAQMKV